MHLGNTNGTRCLYLGSSQNLTNLDAYTYGTLSNTFKNAFSKTLSKSFKILSKTDTASEGDVGFMQIMAQFAQM